jgi:ubiquinone/menaquinone biosynthesis C-methylase UbiE
MSGTLTSAAGRRYPIVGGIPNLLYPEHLSAIEASTKDDYDRVAERIYDVAVDWQFAAFREDEDAVREGMIDLLQVGPDDRILEVGCGTGRDSFRLARRLSARGALFMQDLSPNMVAVCARKMAEYTAAHPTPAALEYSVSNALHLPFADGFFDSVFHFGGFNQFGDLARGAAELARVTRVGGRVLIGDEAVAPWLKGTEFESIVTTNNPLFRADAPLHVLPAGARDVTLKWIIANCFYVIAFTKGEGAPPLDLDLPHAGWRGGTMRSRFFGVMEGVTPEAKALAREAAAAAGVSVHDWLDGVVRAAAAKGRTS